ncbi:hypothetical protein PTKIN_Ptkin03bG0150400 [Pterospermum kingtungense]
MDVSLSMEEVEIKHSGAVELELCCQQQNESPKKNEEAGGSCSQQSGVGCMVKQDSNKAEASKLLEKGLMEYGCSHYRRRCRIRAPCCGEIFACRHCHNEAKNNINVDQKLRHDIPRHQVSQVICSLCGTEQEVQQVCINCGVCMGKYFCQVCKLFDDDTTKEQYHCDGCGICRIGGRKNFFHCCKCGSMHHDCPVCFEFLFESRSDVTVLPCGHTIHSDCLKEMRGHYQISIRPALLYGSDCWAVKRQDEHKMSVAEMRMLRWMCGKTRKDRVRNETIQADLKVALIEDKMRESHLRWFGYVIRRPKGAPVRRCEAFTVGQERKTRGRPLKTWKQVIRQDMSIREVDSILALDRN